MLFIVVATICVALPIVRHLRRDPDWYKHAWFKCRIPNALAITFDDGPGNSTAEIIDKLNESNVTGTFFVNGRTSVDITRAREKALVKKAYDHGHQIASHTYTHNDLSAMNATQVKWEMLQLEKALQAIIGVRPRYMRPPYGRLSDLALGVIEQLGYHIIIWNIDTNDWKHPQNSQESYQQYVNAMANAHRDTSFIALQHDIHPATNAAYVERVVKYAKSLGKRIVRIDECIGEPNTAYIK
ncbi:hypothetical protein BDF22DRAFT_621885 [Syncephalis plumigaleata]|nr:hypothetical protein BDF22DRAFT_621885 [Syncephalis plumigaleata]